VQIDWHKLDAEQWFVDETGVFWLEDTGVGVLAYLWGSGNMQRQDLPVEHRPVAIYSSGKGLGYVVQPRLHDTDIVWLQNRR
jgi:hypothetical protein